MYGSDMLLHPNGADLAVVFYSPIGRKLTERDSPMPTDERIAMTKSERNRPNDRKSLFDTALLAVSGFV